MIDTHCHLLPGVDDGPATQAEALDLARVLERDGVSFVVCTPHYSRHHPTDHGLAHDRLRALVAAMASAGVSLEAGVAAEVSPEYAVAAPLDALAARSIAGRFVVVEVLPATPATFFAAVEARLAEAGLHPIFAHPERCEAVQRRPSCLDGNRRTGSLVQVVAPSLLGRWGKAAAAAAWRLVDSGCADLLASDAHGATRRQAHLREAVALVAQRLGATVAADLSERNPAVVLAGGHPS
jgi:protein-tyrosine phosphatase